MSDEEINIAIAEVCGWKRWSKVYTGKREEGWKSPASPAFVLRIPNYCADLNAMHEAEKYLTNQFTTTEETYWRNLKHVNPHPIYATARQRAEAFLRVIGKWKEEAK